MGLVFFGLDKREIYNLFQEFHVFTLAKFLKVIIAKQVYRKMLLKCHAFACHAILLRHVQTLESHPSLHSPISSLKKRETTIPWHDGNRGP